MAIVVVGVLAAGVPASAQGTATGAADGTHAAITVPAGHPVERLRTFDHGTSTASFDAYVSAGSVGVLVQGEQRVTVAITVPEGVDIADLVGATAGPDRAWLSVDVGYAGACDGGESVTVHEYDVRDGEVATLAFDFSTTCGGSSPIVGSVRFDAAARDAPAPPPPSGLWDPGDVPTGGSFLRTYSESGDHVGGGRHRSYTDRDAVIHAEPYSGGVEVTVHGDQRWRLVVRGWSGRTLRPGFHGPYHDGPREMTIASDSRECNLVEGWVVVDELERDPAGAIERFAARFEQRCGEGRPVLRAAVRYEAGRPLVARNPRPSPGPRWAPPASDVPGTGTFLHLVGADGSWVGDGQRSTWTESDADFHLTFRDYVFRPVDGVTLDVRVIPRDGSSVPSGQLALPIGTSKLQAGYHGRLRESIGHHPLDGGHRWSAGSRACNDAAGWFVVDDVRYEGDELRSLAVRFEQRCFTNPWEMLLLPPVRGELRWRSDAPRPVGRQLVPDRGDGGFRDVTGGPHRPAIDRLAGQRIVGGYADGTYRPARSISRAELASLLVRGLQVEAPSGTEQVFSDVAPGRTHGPAIAAAARLGLVQGFSDGRFGPDRPVTRGQVASMYARAMDLPLTVDVPFRDLDGNVHRDAISVLTWARVVAGYDDATYRPGLPVTRAQVASLLDRMLRQLD